MYVGSALGFEVFRLFYIMVFAAAIRAGSPVHDILVSGTFGILESEKLVHLGRPWISSQNEQSLFGDSLRKGFRYLGL